MTRAGTTFRPDLEEEEAEALETRGTAADLTERDDAGVVSSTHEGRR